MSSNLNVGRKQGRGRQKHAEMRLQKLKRIRLQEIDPEYSAPERFNSDLKSRSNTYLSSKTIIQVASTHSHGRGLVTCRQASRHDFAVAQGLSSS